jgi:predicted metal-dependent enzyme (double-stranded beta helix superfamily)
VKLLYKPVSILVSVLGGIVAGAIFKQVWKFARHEDDAPKATDIQRGWGEVLLAATLQGAIFALVKAALDRGAADATLRLTGFWPGTDSEAEAEKAAEKAKEKTKA